MRCRGIVILCSVIAALTSVAVICLLVMQVYDTSCPEGAFPCMNSSVCIPQRAMCNQHVDCQFGDDEDVMKCADLHGHFKGFVGSLPRKNSTSDCLMDFVPEECVCSEMRALWCKNRTLIEVPTNISSDVRKLILANNSLVLNNDSFSRFTQLNVLHLEGNSLTALPSTIFANLTHLRRLLLMNNQLQVIPEGLFTNLTELLWLLLQNNELQVLHMDSWVGLDQLSWLDLSYNKLALEEEGFPALVSLEILFLSHNTIEIVRENTFSALEKLSDLDLSYNIIRYIHEDAFSKLKRLKDLDLTYNQIYFLDDLIFLHLTSLEKLLLGNNPLQSVSREMFQSLHNLSSLNLQGIEIEQIDIQTFQTLKKLDFVYFKWYYYCTYAPSVPKCKPNTDGVSSFEHLLSRPVQRVTVWFVGVFTCFANALVVWGRVTGKDENQALSFVIRNLAVADLLMGVYLITIAYEDVKYRGVYNREAFQWMSSWACTVIGITAMVSSEVSVMILAFLSLDRFLLIAVPFSGHRSLSLTSARLSLLSIWMLGVVIAVVPVLHWRNSTRFYGANGLCFPLHIDDPFLMGWQYSALVFVGINSTILILMVIIYSAMFVSIWRTRTATTINVGDSEFALKFFLIVLTDTLCWLPIITIKVMALFRVPISGTLYAWVVIFILPVNSAVNPLLYTFTTPKYCAIIKRIGFSLANKRSKNSKKNANADTESSNSFNRRNNLPTCNGCKVNEEFKRDNGSFEPYKLCDFVEENI